MARSIDEIIKAGPESDAWHRSAQTCVRCDGPTGPGRAWCDGCLDWARAEAKAIRAAYTPEERAEADAIIAEVTELVKGRMA